MSKLIQKRIKTQLKNLTQPITISEFAKLVKCSPATIYHSIDISQIPLLKTRQVKTDLEWSIIIKDVEAKKLIGITRSHSLNKLGINQSTYNYYVRRQYTN